MENLLNRFITYCKFDTQSDEASPTCPSTAKQLELGKFIASELEKIGLKDIELDKNGYVMATLPANTDKQIPVIGFIAHLDTAPDASGANVNPQVIKDYDGKDIVLNKDKNIIMSPADFPELKLYKGKTLITTDGNTLLGADDKAGVAEIVTAVEYLTLHPEIKHGKIRIAFTPDEEIGRGADKFDVEKFGADFAYTVDGGIIGELEYENFNAAKADININGRNVHPGTAKNIMKNAAIIAMELNSLLPAHQRPEHTENYEGFYHLIRLDATVDKAKMTYIIRDHDRNKFEQKKQLMLKAAEYINEKYGENTVEIILKDQYYNMREKIEPVMHIIDTAKKAMELCNVEPHVVPIRGGTDGARLSYMGLPTPNLFTGGHNFHGIYEYIPYESMQAAVNVIVKIIELYANK